MSTTSALSDAELLLGLARHLGAYGLYPERAALQNLEFCGQVIDFAFRLRGSTSSTAERTRVLALDANLGPRDFIPALTILQQLSWAQTTTQSTGELISVIETVPEPSAIVAAADAVLSLVFATATDRAVLHLLRSTSLMPMLAEEAKQAASVQAADSEVEDALRYLTATGLIRRVETDDSPDVLYNPNIWVQGDEVAVAALRAADASATPRVLALLEELAAAPGLPEDHVKSTEPRWVKFAVSQGLVQRAVIQTSDGNEKAFLFSPHIARDPFGGTAGDASGQVRQLVGSMIYAATFARFRLDQPAVFLRSLISRGIAGNVSNIGTDYPMLEKAGIVRVVPGRTSGRYALELLQPNVAEDALTLLSERGSDSAVQDVSALRAQRSYVHVEKARAQLAMETVTDQVEEQRLIAALRDESTRRTMGGW